MNGVATADYLARASLLRLLAVMALVVAPHAQHVPLWTAITVAGIGLWRAAAALNQWPLPRTWLRMLLTFGAFAGIYASFGRVSGQTAGVALLVLMTALKLTEMRTRRDVMVTVFLCYFMLITHFLFSQELWMVAYLLVCAAAITAVLIEANHAGEPLSPRVSLRLSGRMLLEALPLMALLFVLFPRIPGPLWGLPSDSGVAARTGLSDSMAPGDIANLIQSDEVAFRVNFRGAVPPAPARYWRGPVFDYFDGRRWSYGGRSGQTRMPALELEAGRTEYEVTLEPHRQFWLFTLDMPDPAVLPEKSRLHPFGNLLSQEQVRERRAYTAVSFTRYRFQPELSDFWRTAGVQLPQRGNPRTRDLAKNWRDAGLDDDAILKRALQQFREQNFYYTLQPPTLGADPVDQFLFETRRGFCEHYASSFTVMMRAAGIPARIVTGYQGGELNTLGGYYVVRQSDAHAWSEVWLANRGWVRVDPTAAVAPSRIEGGLSSALGQTGELPDYMQRRSVRWRFELEARWDFINAKWNAWVLAYGPELQLEFLNRFGIGDVRSMLLTLTAVSTLFLTVVGFLMLRQTRAAAPSDAALNLWRRAQKRLARTGILQRPYEGPRDFIDRAIEERPDLREALQTLRDAYLRLRYLEEPGRALQAELAAAVKNL
jgi:transglutaminase-like putative cysteine protease